MIRRAVWLHRPAGYVQGKDAHLVGHSARLRHDPHHSECLLSPLDGVSQAQLSVVGYLVADDDAKGSQSRA